jgi:hypothetical protein
MVPALPLEICRTPALRALTGFLLYGISRQRIYQCKIVAGLVYLVSGDLVIDISHNINFACVLEDGMHAMHKAQMDNETIAWTK